MGAGSLIAPSLEEVHERFEMGWVVPSAMDNEDGGFGDDSV